MTGGIQPLRPPLWYFVLICAFFAVSGEKSYGTPILALKEVQNCAGCHKPGRSQKPFLDRRCTLDCQGCHVDPSGAGARSQWGYYYTQAKEGVAAVNFYEPQDPLQDKSIFDIHYDGRLIRRDLPDKTRTFPMSSEFTFRLRPFVRFLHLTYSSLLLGNPYDKTFRMVREGDRGYRERFSAMVDEIPLNTYVRAYRGIPMYGLRRPNHTLWIRERIGLDQFATTDAVEIGTSPNVPFFRASYMKGDPYVDLHLRQKGMSFHGGVRGVTLGWHFNGSGWKTKSEVAEINMSAVGAGLNVFGLILYGEQNRRRVNIDPSLEDAIAAGDESETPIKIHPSSFIKEYTVAFAGVPGVIFGGIFESLKDDYNNSERRSAFIDVHPIPNIQIEYWRRFETGSRTLADSLAIAHWYLDF